MWTSSAEVLRDESQSTFPASVVLKCKQTCFSGNSFIALYNNGASVLSFNQQNSNQRLIQIDANTR